MDVLRERECKDSMERQLSDERKLRGKFFVFTFFPRTFFIFNNTEITAKEKELLSSFQLCILIRLVCFIF